MTMVENKYEARLLDEDNDWGTPSDEQDLILAMTAEIKALKQGNNKGPISNKKGNKKSNKEPKDKNNKDSKKERPASENGRTQHPGITMLKKMEFQSGNSRRRSIFGVHMNNGAGMWTLHHPKDCQANNKDNNSSPRADVVMFDTADSDSDLIQFPPKMVEN